MFHVRGSRFRELELGLCCGLPAAFCLPEGLEVEVEAGWRVRVRVRMRVRREWPTLEQGEEPVVM
jgi:hypothetical protein